MFIHSLEDKNKKELIEIINIQIEEYQKLTNCTREICLFVFDRRGKSINADMLVKARDAMSIVEGLPNES